MKNILVIQLYRYGDILQSTPAIAAMRRDHPEARIHVLVRSSFSGVLRGNPDVDEVLEWDVDRLLSGPKGASPMAERMAYLRESVAPLRTRDYDAVYNFSNDLPSALLMYLLRPRHAAGLMFERDRTYRVHNEWMQYLFRATDVRCMNTINLVDILIGACGGKGRQALKIATAPDDEAHADALLPTGTGPVIGLQVGASKDYKRWPARHFTALAVRLGQEGGRLVFFGSEAERAEVEEIHSRCNTYGLRALNVAGRTTFGQLAAFLKRCRLLISNDTATAHVAAAVGTPSLVLTFGSASGWDTGPYGDGHFIVEPAVTCAPCQVTRHCPELPCRDLLTLDAVHAAAVCALSGGREIPDALRRARVRVHRTEWMPDGLLGLRPLGEPPLTLKDLLRAILRTHVLRRHLHVGGAEEWRPWLSDLFGWHRVEDAASLGRDIQLAVEDLERLRALAELGVQAAGTVLQHTGGGASDVETRKRLGAAVERLEGRILAAEENEVLRFLVAGFRHAMADMASLPPREKAALHRWNYRSLADGCAYVRDALCEAQLRLVDTHQPALLVK